MSPRSCRFRAASSRKMYRQQKNGRSAIVPVAGEQAFSRLVNAVQSNFVTLVFRCTLTIAVAAALAVYNRGSILAAFDEVGIDENGTTRHIYDGRVLRFISEMAAPSALSAVRVPASGAIGVYNLEEAVRIYFAHPFAAVPRETAYLERDVKQIFSAYVKLKQNAVNFIAPPGGGGTSVITNMTVSVISRLRRVRRRRARSSCRRSRSRLSMLSPTNDTSDGIHQDVAFAARSGRCRRTRRPRAKLRISSTRLRSRAIFTTSSAPSSLRGMICALEQEFDFGGAVTLAPTARISV
jgi:hypothetical protein